MHNGDFSQHRIPRSTLDIVTERTLANESWAKTYKIVVPLRLFAVLESTARAITPAQVAI